MERFLVYDKNGFYGNHILKENFDVFLDESIVLDQYLFSTDFKILYFVYDFVDVFKSIELRQRLDKELIFVIMDDCLMRIFKKQKKIEFYTYRQIFNILKNR